MDPVEESDDDQYLDFAEYMGHVADGHGGPQMDDMWDDVYNDYMGHDEEGVWGFNGSDAEDYLDDYFLDSDYYDDEEEERHEYFTWEEDSPKLSDRFLTDWKPMSKPGQMSIFPDCVPSNSIIGPSWERLKAARLLMSQEGMRKNEQVSYEQLYVMAVQNERMLAAWKKRMEKTGINWDVKDVEEGLGSLKLTGTKGEEPEPVEFDGNREIMTVQERVKYSVEKLMEILGNSRQLDNLTYTLSNVKNWLQKHMMESLNSCLPLSLPYPALATLFKALYEVSNCNAVEATPQLGLIDSSNAENLVEEKYMVRLYLSMADVYNVLREIMFRHSALTRLKCFKPRFQYMRSRIHTNLVSIKALHDRQNQEQSTNKPDMHWGTQNCFYAENETGSIASVTNVHLSNKFVVAIYDHTEQLDAQFQTKLEIKIFNTETGKIESAFPVEIQPGFKRHASNRFCFKSTISLVEDLILYGVFYGDGASQAEGSGSSFASLRCVVLDWRKRKVLEDMTIEGICKPKEAVDWYSPRLIMSKVAEKVCIAQEYQGIDFFYGSSHYFLKVFEAGSESPKLILDTSAPAILMKKWLVITTDLKSDQQSLTSVKWIDLATYEVMFEDLYPTEKVPSICFDTSSEVSDNDSLNFVQVNDLGKTEIWRIQPSGQKEILQQFELEMEEFYDGHRFLKYSHPYMLTISNTEGMADDFIVMDLSKISLYHFMGDVNERQVIFYTNCPNKLLSFHTFQFPAGAMSIDLDRGAVVIMTELMKRIDGIQEIEMRLDAHVKKEVFAQWSRFDFGIGEFEAIREDIKMAEEVLKKVEEQKSSESSYDGHAMARSKDLTNLAAMDMHSEAVVPNEKQSGMCGWLGWTPSIGTLETKNMEDIINSGERVIGELIDWKENFGYVKLDFFKDTPNIFVHISDIKKPIPFLKVGLKFEVSITEDKNEKQLKAVDAVALN